MFQNDRKFAKFVTNITKRMQLYQNGKKIFKKNLKNSLTTLSCFNKQFMFYVELEQT